MKFKKKTLFLIQFFCTIVGLIFLVLAQVKRYDDFGKFNYIIFLIYVLYIFSIIKMVLKMITTAKRQRVTNEFMDIYGTFYTKYGLDVENMNFEEIDKIIRGIANVNSDYPEDDKKIAQELARYHQEIKEINNLK